MNIKLQNIRPAGGIPSFVGRGCGRRIPYIVPGFAGGAADVCHGSAGKNTAPASARTLFVCQSITGVMLFSAMILLAGCTVVPKGENRLRHAAAIAGKPFEKPYAQRHLPPLPVNATPAEMVRYAVLNSPAVEKAYWKWRASIEQIPQAGTQLTTLMLNAGTTLQNGQASLANTILGAGNMTSADIRWPSKLSADAKAALQAARAAGWQYRSEIFAVRRNVLAAWYRYAQTSVVLRLAMSQQALLNSLAALSKAGISTGGRNLGQWLAARNSINQLQTEIIDLRNGLPRDLATLNALLGRAAAASLSPPDNIPHIAPPAIGNHALLMLALRRNPDIRGLRRFISADRISIRRAKLQYIPNFGLGVSSSLDGTAQSISSALVVPVFRYKAINASIAQARDRLRGEQAALRDRQVTIAARLLIDLLALRNDRQQLALFAGRIVPRVKMITVLTRTNYQQGLGTVREQLKAQQELLALAQTIAELQTDQDIRIADIDAIIAAPM
ncbi:MAG: TolC family protein [Phycisphaerae bacterium]